MYHRILKHFWKNNVRLFQSMELIRWKMKTNRCIKGYIANLFFPLTLIRLLDRPPIYISEVELNKSNISQYYSTTHLEIYDHTGVLFLHSSYDMLLLVWELKDRGNNQVNAQNTQHSMQAPSPCCCVTKTHSHPRSPTRCPHCYPLVSYLIFLQYNSEHLESINRKLHSPSKLLIQTPLKNMA